MKTTKEYLITDLIERTQKNLNAATRFKELPTEVLNWKMDAEKWSILECLEHLNRYGDFYIPEIKRQIEKSKYPASDNFRSGWLGNYFANAMLPGKPKMKTFRSMNPANSQLSSSVIDHFIQHQHQLLNLLDEARGTNLSKVRTGITISRWITLRLGDTLRVVIYHNQRHIEQANRNLQIYKADLQ